ncbi:hypothetical protein [Poseidonibacter sp.]|uniref:hypothetical protein n=1 Tax=Poseidonibacter sp. TaxID=2321188 RepID=UPI003C722156
MNRLFTNRTKTEALLIYIKITLEKLFLQIDNDEYMLKLISYEDSQIVLESLRKLLTLLKSADIKDVYVLKEILLKNNTAYSPYLDELIQYYNSIVVEVEKELLDGDLWIPEQFILSLLAEWILEENQTKFYPFLAEFDYLDLLSKFEEIKTKEHEMYKNKVYLMYKISRKTIDMLKKEKFKSSIIKKQNKKRKR